MFLVSSLKSFKHRHSQLRSAQPTATQRETVAHQSKCCLASTSKTHHRHPHGQQQQQHRPHTHIRPCKQIGDNRRPDHPAAPTRPPPSTSLASTPSRCRPTPTMKYGPRCSSAARRTRSHPSRCEEGARTRMHQPPQIPGPCSTRTRRRTRREKKSCCRCPESSIQAENAFGRSSTVPGPPPSLASSPPTSTTASTPPIFASSSSTASDALAPSTPLSAPSLRTSP